MNYAYWLANIEGIGNQTKKRILAQVGTAEELYHLSEQQIRLLVKGDEPIVSALLRGRKKDVQASYEWLGANGISFLSIEDDAYPRRLREIWDAPYGLYVKGRMPSDEMPVVAIVGARMCSEYGRAVAVQLGRKLAARGVCVVSGMARGIDAAGHIGVIEAAGITCAVLGCGVDVCYPKMNQKLYMDILERGCIISEYSPGTQPRANLFPQRNRIISGLSDVVVVVEARERSGSLITADQALEQGKDVYAVPGRIYDPLSRGCNALISQGAGIISSVDDFVKELVISGTTDYCQEKFENLLLEKEELLVYSCVDLRPKSMEEILQKTQIAMPELAHALAGLVQKGFITEVFKNCYIRRV